MAASEELEALRTRIETLERLLLGSEYVKKEHSSIHDVLGTVDDGLRSLRVLDNDSIRKVWTNVEEIQRLVSDEGDRDAVSEELKLEYILSREQSIKDTAKLLENISSMKGTLDESSLKYIGTAEGRMPALVQHHVRQQADVVEAGKKAKEILTAYNEATVAISDLFLSLSGTV